jgi:antitoxin (DNA-binding transcriptional repressor) of toxin-antitoxin stability system
MKNEIGACEAKTRLPELLREVKAGSRFTITHHGEAIAELGPTRAARAEGRAQQAVEAFEAFLSAHPVKRGVSRKALIEEGRA